MHTIDPRHYSENGRRAHTRFTDFLKFVFILLDIGPAPMNFLLDPLNFAGPTFFYVKLF
jgi:hypothetical protein